MKNLLRFLKTILKRKISLMKAKLWLQDKAIELLSQNCTSIGIVFPKNFKRTISSKLDDLIFVIPVFAKLFKTVGCLLKENIEQIHNIFNIILFNLLCMRENQSSRD